MEFTDFFFHKHPLILNEVINERNRCNACDKILSRPTYTCRDCKFNIHKSCAELPQKIQNPYHQHSLTLLPDRRDSRFCCYACTEYREGFYFHCEKCDFDVDIECAFWKLTKDEGQDQLHHFTHLHPLVSTKKQQQANEKDYGYCKLCGETNSCELFGCDHCNYYLHRSCAELQLLPTLQHFYHPCLLTLCLDRQGTKCQACDRYNNFYYFFCKACNFFIDISCARLPTIMESLGQRQFHHFSHGHPLKVTEIRHDNVSCKICGEPRSDVFYVCSRCKYYLHRSCAELQLPPTLQHYYHPCLLTLLLARQDSRCQACGQFDKFYFYLCKPCNFKIDIRCARLPIIMESLGQQQFHHFSHGHPLKHIEIKLGDEIVCSACKKLCSGQTYVCCSNKCKFSLHESCFGLPKKICHPFHPPHPLTLYSEIHYQYSKPKCKVCYNVCLGFTLYCDDCKFHMDVECPRISSSIKYQGHHHNIIFIKTLDPSQPDKDDDTDLECDACCRRLRSLEAMFRCVECDFHLHLQCGPLPCFIKHESHPCCYLKLTDSPVIIEGEDKDTDEFYCDTCEKKRDPRLPIYYCSDGCAYIAEIKCVISEVLLSLRGEYGEIELRSGLFKHQAGKVICKGTELAWQDSITDRETIQVNPSLTMHDIINAIPEEEKSEMCTAYKHAQIYDFRSANKSAFSGSDEDCAIFIASMRNHELEAPRLDKPDKWRGKKLVNVRNHLIIPELAPIFEKLYAKYGNSIFETKLESSGLRTYFSNLLCEIIRLMCIIRVADMPEEMLFGFWRYLRMIQYVGFEVDFVLDRLKRVVHAYYALQVKKQRTTQEIDKEIEEASQQIKELEAKIMALKKNAREVSPQNLRLPTW